MTVYLNWNVFDNYGKLKAGASKDYTRVLQKADLRNSKWFPVVISYNLIFYPQILEQEQFKCIEKIKTIGYTYMAASGLTNDKESIQDMGHVIALTDFAFAIQEQLKSVNEHSFNNFKMRIGKSETWNDINLFSFFFKSS